LLEWAATAAKGSAAHTIEYLQFMNGIPEDRAELRGAFITSAKRFMGTSEGPLLRKRPDMTNTWREQR
jgi:hypothetical protein